MFSRTSENVKHCQSKNVVAELSRKNTVSPLGETNVLRLNGAFSKEGHVQTGIDIRTTNDGPDIEAIEYRRTGVRFTHCYNGACNDILQIISFYIYSGFENDFVRI